MKKAKNIQVNIDYLQTRTKYLAHRGFKEPKWIFFCKTMIERGLTVHLYEAKRTFSKYVTVSHLGGSFKVRFSNHKPNKDRESNGDCDFFVGVANQKTTTTTMAIGATLSFFEQLEVA